ncbi:ATP-binding protein [Niabella sp. W65]|nr:ATP-binding protein [Niabella sp. W65]MCH7362801.1 ATP-binding protein [Niabella sp. W65]
MEDLPHKYSSTKKLRYDLFDSSLFERMSEEYKMLEHLRQLGMLSSPEIDLKRNNGYSLQESSSGEYHFFSSMVGLLACVDPESSLVLLDEPEVSLHPNWQMKYMAFLRELFAGDNYASCHVLVATHSHFIISDLKNDSSKILGLKREKGKIELVDLPPQLDTFGWSAEDILYNVFNVRSSLNYYLEADLTELLGMIANNIQEKGRIGEILEKLEKLPSRKNDPLQEIILEAREYYNNIV